MLISQETLFNNRRLSNITYSLTFTTETNRTTLITIKPNNVNAIKEQFPQITTYSLHITYTYNHISNRLSCHSNFIHLKRNTRFLFNCKRHYSDLLNGIAQIPLFEKLYLKELIYFIESIRVGSNCSYRTQFRRPNTFIKDFTDILGFIEHRHPEPFTIYHNNFDKIDHCLTSSMTTLYPTSLINKYCKYQNNVDIHICRY